MVLVVTRLASRWAFPWNRGIVMRMKPDVRQGAWRSRWAAVGAAVAVTLGAGGMVAVNAAPSEPSSFVSITPTRILDTRTDVGLAGPFVSGVAQTLQVTGTVPTQPPGGAAAVNAEVVPSTATSVVFNVTVVNPQTNGFLSVRPVRPVRWVR
jgi:multisubunit Na+/H+ antiporter MnhB subunit